jgi:hypothetical protein
MLETFFSLIISLKASAWILSEKVRDVFKSFFIAKIDIPGGASYTRTREIQTSN